MNRVTRNRERNLHVIDAVVPMDGGVLVMRRAPGARVGYESETTIRAYAREVDARYDLLDEELRRRFIEKWGAGTFIVSESFGDPLLGDKGLGFDSTGYKYSYVFNPAKTAVIPADRLKDYSSDKEFYTSWVGALNGWRFYYVETSQKKFIVPGIFEASGEHDKIASYDLIQRDWQKLASERGIKTTTPPKPPVVDENGNPLDGFSGLLKNITWVIGLGFVFYIFTMFIAPPLLSGAARTKDGYRGLRD